MNAHRRTHIHIYMYIYVHTHIKTHMHIYMYVYIYICVYIYIYTLIYTCQRIFAVCRDGYVYAYIYRSSIMCSAFSWPKSRMHVYIYTHKYIGHPLCAVPLVGQRVTCMYIYIYTHIYTLYIRQCIFKVPVFCSRVAYM